MDHLPVRPRYGHFNWIAPYYDAIFGREHHEALYELLQAEPGHLVLDIGGGTGRVAVRLAAGGARVVVVDPSSAMLARALSRDLVATRAIAEHLPFVDESVDRVFVVDAFHHFADHALAARELVRVLRPGGRIVIEEPDIRRPIVKVVALAERLALMQSRFYSPPDLADLFTAAGARLVTTTQSAVSVHVVLER